MQDRGLYSLLNITNVESCPKTLEEHYRLTADLSGFTENVIDNDELSYFVEYNNTNNIHIAFSQNIKTAAYALNTESKNPPVEVKINGCNGVYYETKHGTHILIWDTGDYLIDIEGNGIGKDDLFSLAKFVQKVE